MAEPTDEHRRLARERYPEPVADLAVLPRVRWAGCVEGYAAGLAAGGARERARVVAYVRNLAEGAKFRPPRHEVVALESLADFLARRALLRDTEGGGDG